VREEDDDPEVLRQVERHQLRALALAELGAGLEEERDVGAERPRQLVQPLGGERRCEEAVGEQQRRRGVGAAAAETGLGRDAFLDARATAARREASASNDRVASRRRAARPGSSMRSDIDALVDGDSSACLVRRRRRAN
jgi:hypothetical protein